jgi:8-hydroxy-5-deazaflavin:NADPH oxidoreductase
VSNRRSVLTGLGAGVAVAALERPARALDEGPGRAREIIAVLGTGHFGGAIGKRLGSLGYSVLYGSRTPDSPGVKALVRESGRRASAASARDAASRGRIVVFAVPWTAVKEMLPGLGDLSGKLLIDPMIANPRAVDKLPFPPDPSTSAAERLQAWVPGAHVVSAFSTIWYKDLADPTRCGGPVSIPIAGDDRGANERVARLTSELALDPVIIGNLPAARYIESLLWMEVACNSSIYNRGTKKLYEIYMRRVPL